MKSYIQALLIILLFYLPLLSQSHAIEPDPYITHLIEQVSRTNIEQHIQNLADANGHQTRVSYTVGNGWAANYIKEAFESFPGISSIEFETFYISGASFPYNGIPLKNVVATLEGDNSTSTNYVVGGHYDASATLDPNLNWDSDWGTAKAQGADDNASGIAAILEIARILSDPVNNFNNQTTIKFVAFAAEERHPVASFTTHEGSDYFVSQAFINGAEISGAYILDMIGYNSTQHHYFNIVSNTLSKDLGLKLIETNQTYEIGLEHNNEPFPDATYSDHERFWAYGYKAILLIENAPPRSDNLPWYTMNPYYHKESDTPDKINLEQVEKVTKMTLGTIAIEAGIPTSIEKFAEKKTISDNFELFQNFPNPFNPSTTISYRLNSRGHVELAIFDIQGQLITKLFERDQLPGIYSQVWNATNQEGKILPSGMYFLSLRFENQIKIQKIMFLK